ncbi:caspase family protein [Planktomarina temperata]|nr:caspase family protein [Planktomarina temperata]
MKPVNGKKIWNTNTLSSSYVQEAKARGLDCGVAYETITNTGSNNVTLSRLGDWEAVSNGLHCWVENKSPSSVAKRNGRVVAVRRGSIILRLILDNDFANLRGEFTPGFPFAQVEMDPKANSVQEMNNNWLNFSTDLTKANKLKAIKITSKSSRGTLTIDEFGTKNLLKLIDFARKIDVCSQTDMSSEASLNKRVLICSDDPTKCSVIELCQQATGTNASGEKFWRMDAALQSYVETAKSNGVTCGVQEDPVAAAREQKQVKTPALKEFLEYRNRKALVIGNANYVDQTPLQNPINDAKAVAAKLKDIGFEVTYKENLKVGEFRPTLGEFRKNLAGSDISLVYYAGHGIEIDKQNYLIPVDAKLQNPDDAYYNAVKLEDAISASLNTGKLSMVLVDACRDNPFAGQLGSGTRSIGRGLSIVEVETGPVNQIVSFAAASGEVAQDGSGNNSPYATALIELLDEPNLDVGMMFRRLGDRVHQMTGGMQQPVKRDNLRGETIFLVEE